MLRVTRKCKEAIVLTIPPSNKKQEVFVILREIKGDRAGICLQADKEVIIDRKEIWDAKHDHPKPSPYYFENDKT